MLRVWSVVVACVLLGVTMIHSGAQAAFDDVPPWHWAASAVATGAQSSVLVGNPAADHEKVTNALVQIYEAFAHAQHPGAVDWAERFLTNLPPAWPQQLRRSRLAGYRLDQVRVEDGNDRRVVSFIVEATMPARDGLPATRSRVRSRVEVRRDQERWRVNYADLATGQPLLFK
jgi:hypothetical protein